MFFATGVELCDLDAVQDFGDGLDWRRRGCVYRITHVPTFQNVLVDGGGSLELGPSPTSELSDGCTVHPQSSPFPKIIFLHEIVHTSIPGKSGPFLRYGSHQGGKCRERNDLKRKLRVNCAKLGPGDFTC